MMYVFSRFSGMILVDKLSVNVHFTKRFLRWFTFNVVGGMHVEINRILCS